MSDMTFTDLVRTAPGQPTSNQKEAPQQTNIAERSGIWIPIPHDALPSRGKYYEEQIQGRPLGATEIKQLSSMNQKNAEALVDQTLKQCIRGVAFDNILVADKLFLLFWLRQNTYKRTGYTTTFECSECGAKVSAPFSIEDLEVNYHPEEGEDLFDIPVGDNIFRVKYRTVADDIEMKNVIKKNANTISFDEDFLTMASSIVAINGETLHLLKKYRYITDPTKFTADDFSELSGGLNAIAIGVNPIVKIPCSKCGGISDTLIPFRPDYFLPANEFRRGNQAGIRSGVLRQDSP